ncbi:ABC transporter [Kocuria rosea subsp. polaris]|uniref:ABC transporter n=1 Tax=Kocuria rosea subsp. polaris TaxID=136273 RepID=A0A0W8IJQ7_KOCRO|nr:DUF302 domain-containing protein [Kocuria polaris]KUG60117.1 ABC transporter [Kocuria polaris]
MSYTNAVVVPLPYAEAVERTRAALSEQGFGILTEIDVRGTFEQKLGAEAAEEVGDYVILGACNPGLASKALAAEPQLSGTPAVQEVADDAGVRLRAALDVLGDIGAQ